MKKVFICSIPMQGRLEPMAYDTSALYGFATSPSTRFPVLSVLENIATPDDDIEILTVNFQNEDTSRNFATFRQELVALGYKTDCIKPITIQENQSDENLLYLYKALARAIPAHSEIAACITYGTKTIPILMQGAIQFACEYKEDVSVRGIFYGELVRESDVVKGAKLYDVSGIYFISSMLANSAPRTLKEADAMLDTLLP